MALEVENKYERRLRELREAETAQKLKLQEENFCDQHDVSRVHWKIDQFVRRTEGKWWFFFFITVTILAPLLAYFLTK